MERGNLPLYVIVGAVVVIVAGMFFASNRDGATPQTVSGTSAPILAAVPAKPVETPEISMRADTVPAPIARTQNERVVVTLKTSEIVAEIMPGVTYQYWTYNGTVPGPMVRAKEGDEIEVQLTHGSNHMHADLQVEYLGLGGLIPTAQAQGQMMDGHDMGSHAMAGHGTHSIDLHSVKGPGGGAGLSQVEHDQTKIFRFTALKPGVYIYHCASAHIPTHIANGMYGMIVVEPKEGLAKVDREFYVMQGELYTSGKFGELGHQSFSKEKMLAEAPEYFVFNGRVGGLTGERALRAKVGEKVRIYVGVGSHIASNFHIIGEIFENLYPEGALSSPPLHNVQTTIIPPGGAVVVEFAPQVPGKYILVDHSLTRAIDKGAVAELIVEGEAVPGILTPVQ